MPLTAIDGPTSETRPTRSRRWTRSDLPRAFVSLWVGSSVSQLGSVGAIASFPLLALAVTGSPVIAGWATAAGTLPSLILHLPAGLLVDRCNAWSIMLISQVVRFSSMLLLVIALMIFDKPIYLVIVAAAIEGSCSVFYNTAEVTSVPRIVPHELLPMAMAKNEVRRQGALLVGRPIGGLLFGFSRLAPVFVNTLTSLVAVGTLWSIRGIRQKARGSDHGLGVFGALAQGLSRLFRDRFLRMVMVACTITNVLFQVVILNFVVLAEEEHRSSLFISTILAASGLGGFLGALIAPRVLRGVKIRDTVVFCVWAWTLLTVAIALCDQPIVMIAAWGGIGLVGAHMNVTLTIYQAMSIPKELLAGVAGASGFVIRGTVALGALGAGYFVSRFGTAASADYIAGLMLVLTLALTAQRLLSSSEADTGHSVMRPPKVQLDQS